MKNFEIKITGSGTKRDIINALKGLADSIKEEGDELEGKTFEDPILCAELKEIEE
jgi:hypothetical protein